eukprot:Nitzschia sp. Nitz4//scaffold43_size134323//36566//37285//NITZ4_003288-RA/size134323-processed-gene-0.7-mRNA-1//1//CDS//3329551915//5221//frame0
MKLLWVLALLLVSLQGIDAFFVPTAFSRMAVKMDAKIDGVEVQGTLEPTNNFVLVKQADLMEKSSGGIILTGSAAKKFQGTVVSIGAGRADPQTGKVKSIPVTPGENVMFGEHDGVEVNIDGVKHTLIRDDDIMVKFSGDTVSLDTVEVIRDRVLVKLDKKDKTTEGGLYISDSKQDARPSTGKVVKAGPGGTAANGEPIAMQVAVDNLVKFRGYAGNHLKIQGEDYVVVSMGDILAKY